MTLSNKAVAFSSLVILCTYVTSCGSSDQSLNVRLSSAGATFPAKVYTRWFSDLAKAGGPKVNYQAIGSGSGRKAFIDETIDFGASDDPMKTKDIAKITRGLVQIPIIGGTIAFGYNKPSCDLQLTQKQAVRVALGIINDWSQLGCTSGKLIWVHRSDGSGTTKAFSNSMQAFSKEWGLGTGKSINWPTGIGAKGNAGVAGIIRNTPGAIGYLNQSYIKGEIKSASLQNLYGNFIKPDINSGSEALNDIKLDNNLAGENPNPITKGAYPISTLTWILAYKTGNGNKTQAIQEVFNQLLSEKYQNKASKLGFVPLKDEILSKSRSAIKLISK